MPKRGNISASHADSYRVPDDGKLDCVLVITAHRGHFSIHTDIHACVLRFQYTGIENII